MPISFVRSTTETNMMLAITIAPTTSAARFGRIVLGIDRATAEKVLAFLKQLVDAQGGFAKVKSFLLHGLG